MTFRVTAALALASLLVLPSLSAAHGVGETLETEVGEYLVDIGYDAAEITKGQEVLFNAALIKDAGTSRWQYAPYDEVWIQIGPKGAEPLRAIIPVKAPSPVNLRYIFASAGTHELSVRFLQDGKILADASFPLAVRGAQGGAGSETLKGLYLIFFGVFLLIIIGVVAYRRYAETVLAAPATLRPAMKPVKKPAARKPASRPKAQPKRKTKAKAKPKAAAKKR